MRNAFFFLILLLQCNLSFSQESVTGKNKTPSVFHPGFLYSKNFPFSSVDVIKVISNDDGSVKICASNIDSCVSASVPKQLKYANKLIAGPFVSATKPSWIAIDFEERIYLCSKSEKNQEAQCVQMGGLSSKDININVVAKGGTPLVQVTSETQSEFYVSNFAEELQSSLKKASKILREGTNSEDNLGASLDGLFSIEANNPPRYPYPGNGGIARFNTIDISGLGKASVINKPTSKKVSRQLAATKGGAASTQGSCLPMVYTEEDGTPVIVTCGSGGGGGGGGGGGDPGYTPPDNDTPPPPPSGEGPSSPCSPGDHDCPIPGERLAEKMCKDDAVERWEKDYDKCTWTNSTASDQERCYKRIADILADDIAYCRRTFGY